MKIKNYMAIVFSVLFLFSLVPLGVSFVDNIQRKRMSESLLQLNRLVKKSEIVGKLLAARCLAQNIA